MITFSAKFHRVLFAFILLLTAGGVALAAMDVPFEREYQQLLDGQKRFEEFRSPPPIGGSSRERETFFPGVRHRIATFTFDDPHETDLGDPVSFLLAKKLLFSTRVGSFAIVNYRQGVDRVSPGGLAYFDRVDALTEDQ